MTDPIEQNDLNLNADLEHFTKERLISTCSVLRKLNDRLASTIDAQARTISEQSETLMNREQIVEDLKANNENFVTLLKEAENAEPVFAVNKGMVNELARSLERYGVNCARIAQTEHHNAIAITFIQVANHIITLPTWEDTLAWLDGTG